MAAYSLREVIALAGLSRNIVMRMVKDAIVVPAGSTSREYRFSFQDLIVLRAARALYAANISPRRVLASLRRLRARLPASIPISGLRISALGCEVVVHESGSRWHADSGQLLLDFDAKPDSGQAVLIERAGTASTEAGRAFELACSLEDASPDAACEHYRRAIDACPHMVSAYVNLGCLLHALKRLDEAQAVYQSGVNACEGQAVLWFNLGVLEEDRACIAEALRAYRSAIALDPEMADAYFNIARLHAALGRSRDAVQAYNAYRRLQRDGGT